MMGKAETYAVAASAAVSFISLAVLTGQEIIYSLSGDVPVSRAVQVVGVNTVAILIVGQMSGRIAEKKRTEEELRKSRESFEDLNQLHELILQSVDTGLITTDLEGTIYSFNRAAERITGVSLAKAIRRPLAETCGSAFGSHVENNIELLRSDRSFTAPFETAIETPDGRSIDVVCSALPLLKRNGEVSGVILTIQDVSKIRALEASLRQADRLAAVGRMAAGLAHEIRNPLGSLGSSLQFLRERVPADSSERTLFDVVLRESDRLNSIITNFLSYARPRGAALRSREETDVDAALRDCLTLMKHDPKVTTAHQFRYEPPATPVRSRISETHVKQVMWNLLQNSVNATPDGGDISVQLDQSAGGRIRMLFQDSGPGFSAESLVHLYEPFSIASAGTGLGLSIVHKIINEHGGRIDVERSNGKGATIVVELPR
jgi:two-component system sensor histidine kinase PilS (NtrC family)